MTAKTARRLAVTLSTAAPAPVAAPTPDLDGVQPMFPPRIETPAARVKRLMAEARLGASEMADDYALALAAIVKQAQECVEAGDAMPAGVRDSAARFLIVADAERERVQSLMQKTA